MTGTEGSRRSPPATFGGRQPPLCHRALHTVGDQHAPNRVRGPHLHRVIRRPCRRARWLARRPQDPSWSAGTTLGCLPCSKRRVARLGVVPVAEGVAATWCSAYAGACMTLGSWPDGNSGRPGRLASERRPRASGMAAWSGALQAGRWAMWSRSVPGTPFSSTGPISVNVTGPPSAASTTSWLTSTSPGLAYSAILAARFTVRPK